MCVGNLPLDVNIHEDYFCVLNELKHCLLPPLEATLLVAELIVGMKIVILDSPCTVHPL